MAHTNSTANYELSQFLGTDKPAWLVDYNGDMLKIDTALKANADAEAASAENIQELQDAIGAEGLTGRITDIENDIGDIKTEIGVVPLPTTAQSLTGAISELKGVNDDQNTAIGQNATNIAQVGGAIDGVAQLAYTIANVYDSTATYAVGDYAIYQNTLYKCTTAINVGETFDPAKWTSVKVMSEVGQGGGSAHKTLIATGDHNTYTTRGAMASYFKSFFDALTDAQKMESYIVAPFSANTYVFKCIDIVGAEYSMSQCTVSGVFMKTIDLNNGTFYSSTGTTSSDESSNSTIGDWYLYA